MYRQKYSVALDEKIKRRFDQTLNSFPLTPPMALLTDNPDKVCTCTPVYSVPCFLGILKEDDVLFCFLYKGFGFPSIMFSICNTVSMQKKWPLPLGVCCGLTKEVWWVISAKNNGIYMYFSFSATFSILISLLFD